MKKGISTILTVSLTVIVMLLLSAGGWYFLDKRQTRDQNNLRQQINELEKQIKEQAPSQTSIESATTTGSSDQNSNDPSQAQSSTAAQSLFDTNGYFSLSQIRRATFVIPDFSGIPFTLANGSYTSGVTTFTLDETVVGYHRTSSTADGVAVILKRTSGGTGVEKYLVILGQKGESLLSTGATDLGDRVKINSINLSDKDHVTVNYLGFGPNDPSCCPSLNTTKNFSWTSGTSLVENN